MGATGCQQYKNLIEQYPWPQQTAMTICEMESGGVATASNWKDSHEGCNGSFGLFQIGCLHGVDREDLYDPATNIKVAYQLWKENGFKPWSTYHKLLALK